MNGFDCTTVGFHTGTLACRTDCSGFDTSKCANTPPPTAPPTTTAPDPTPAPAPSEDDPDLSVKVDICFSGNTQVTVQNKGLVEMKNLQVGDHVWTGTTYEQVYSFGHLDTVNQHEYLQIYAAAAKNSNAKPLEISAAHLIYKADNDRQPVRADTLQVGDRLLQQTIQGGRNNKVVTVRKIETVVRPGAYQPLTPSGDIVVNGIQASTYVSIHRDAPTIVDTLVSNGILSEQALFHWWLAPYRMLCMGVSSKICQRNFNSNNENNSSGEQGIIYWLQIGQQLAKFGEEQHWIGQMVGLLLVLGLMSVFVIAEAVFGSRLGLVGVFMMTAVAVKFYRYRFGQRQSNTNAVKL